MMLEGYKTVTYKNKGKDTFSDVLIIQDEKTEDCYALKVIKGINTPLHRVLFEREVEALTKLRICENIVKLIDFDIDNYKDEEIDYGDCGYIFLEYIEGKGLDEIDVFELSNSEKYKIIEQLIDAIQVAHENNIIHRDISPKNIMVHNDNKVKLIDFGISKIKDMVNDATVYQFVTNGYAAPEVKEHSENATEQSDIYSLGAVIYYLFTGEEPPLSYKVKESLSHSGIDVDLRKILLKMMETTIDERYKDIFDVKKDLFAFIGKMNKSDKKYIVKINSKVLTTMKNNNLVPQYKMYDKILSEDIHDDFVKTYVDVKNQDNGSLQYIFYGNSIELRCYYNKENQMFLTTVAKKIFPNARAFIKNKSMEINGEVKFVFRDTQEKNNNFELTNELQDFKVNFNSRENINNEYSKNFSAWHKFLDIMEESSKRESIKIRYNSVEKVDKYIVFNISEEDYYRFDKKDDSDMIFVIEESSHNKKTRTLEVGSYSKVEVDNDKYYLYLIKSNRISMDKIPKSGVISEDYRKKIKLIQREKKAITGFNNEQYVGTNKLKGIFSGVSNASSFNRPAEIKYFNKVLDPSQKKAIEKVLNSQDIALIQGPPGTGKTNVIIEIIRQIINYGKKGDVFRKKILLVSQAHAAVDKMLEDLDECNCENLKVIRVGRDENFTNLVKVKYAIDKVQDAWVDEVIKKCKKNKKKMLNYLKVNEDEFDVYYKSIREECEDFKENELKNEKESIINFEEKYSKSIEKSEFQGLLIQQDWMNRIQSDLEIEKYFVKNSNIVAGTCTGFLSNKTISDMVFDYLIVDEAAKATFPELLISIIRAKKIILVGDHKQLPPVLDENLIRKSRNEFEESKLDVNTLYDGVFYRLFNHLKDTNKQTLLTQYRMHPTIGTMVSQMFYKEEKISNGVTEEERLHNIKEYKGLAIVWISTSKCSNRGEKRNCKGASKTYSNILEANIVREQLSLINKYSNNDIEVGVITPYSAQKIKINEELKNLDLSRIKDEVVVNSVDAFQGGQKDIIIYSTVRSNNENKIGFLDSQERLNVAFSRAKKLLIIVGDKEFLNRTEIKNNRFPEIISYINSKEDCKFIDYRLKKRIQKR
ncbi:protein kinase [Clostridium bornimense]|uniref:serine/threonine-protein kinase n=1 Tax=Clostridium bornimense TaxID=1216932 RepID=UPI001C102A11|nr:serine/threonine-protein kinase [Clostridium bornimense]MBU5317826.1 protein kinase [Clostridium bornimense]